MMPACIAAATLPASYAEYHAADLIASFGSIGPPSIDVWISSAVRSRKPVLTKKRRSLTAFIVCARLRDVRRSSSITPILIVLRGRPSTSSTRLISVPASAASSDPCIFGLTM